MIASLADFLKREIKELRPLPDSAVEALASGSIDLETVEILADRYHSALRAHLDEEELDQLRLIGNHGSIVVQYKGDGYDATNLLVFDHRCANWVWENGKITLRASITELGRLVLEMHDAEEIET